MLIDWDPGDAPEPSDPDREPVVVLESNDPVQLAMAKGLLVDAGIPMLVGGQIATLIQDVDGMLRKWVRLQVPRGCEQEAREILQLLDPGLHETGEDAYLI